MSSDGDFTLYLSELFSLYDEESLEEEAAHIERSDQNSNSFADTESPSVSNENLPNNERRSFPAYTDSETTSNNELSAIINENTGAQTNLLSNGNLNGHQNIDPVEQHTDLSRIPSGIKKNLHELLFVDIPPDQDNYNVPESSNNHALAIDLSENSPRWFSDAEVQASSSNSLPTNCPDSENQRLRNFEYTHIDQGTSLNQGASNDMNLPIESNAQNSVDIVSFNEATPSLQISESTCNNEPMASVDNSHIQHELIDFQVKTGDNSTTNSSGSEKLRSDISYNQVSCNLISNESVSNNPSVAEVNERFARYLNDINSADLNDQNPEPAVGSIYQEQRHSDIPLDEHVNTSVRRVEDFQVPTQDMRNTNSFSSNGSDTEFQELFAKYKMSNLLYARTRGNQQNLTGPSTIVDQFSDATKLQISPLAASTSNETVSHTDPSLPSLIYEYISPINSTSNGISGTSNEPRSFTSAPNTTDSSIPVNYDSPSLIYGIISDYISEASSPIFNFQRRLRSGNKIGDSEDLNSSSSSPELPRRRIVNSIETRNSVGSNSVFTGSSYYQRCATTTEESTSVENLERQPLTGGLRNTPSRINYLRTHVDFFISICPVILFAIIFTYILNYPLHLTLDFKREILNILDNVEMQEDHMPYPINLNMDACFNYSVLDCIALMTSFIGLVRSVITSLVIMIDGKEKAKGIFIIFHAAALLLLVLITICIILTNYFSSFYHDLYQNTANSHIWFVLLLYIAAFINLIFEFAHIIYSNRRSSRNHSDSSNVQYSRID